MAVALIAHTIGGGSLTGFTSGAINTIGSNLIAVGVAYYLSGSGLTLTDSAGNTWVSNASYVTNDVVFTWFYCLSPITSSLHTFTVAGTSVYAAAAISAWSGVAACDQTVTGSAILNGSGFSVAAGSQTPSANGDLILAGIGLNNVNTVSIGAGLTIIDQENYNAGNYWGTAHAYLLQVSAAAINPTWSWSNGANAAASLLTFTAMAGGGGATVHGLAAMGVGS